MKGFEEGVIHSHWRPQGKAGICSNHEGPWGSGGYVRCVTRDGDMPLSYSHSLFPVPFTKSISAKVYWEILCVKVRMFWLGSQSPGRGGGCCSFSDPSPEGGCTDSLVPERSPRVSCYCLSVPPPLFFLCFIVSINTRRCIFELGELFILIFSSLIQWMFTYHTNVT